MELSYERRFLTLSYNQSQNCYFAKLESSLQRVLSNWTPTTRISPVFGIKDFRHKTFSFSKDKFRHFLFFIGPLSPVRLHEFIPKRVGLWLSLGLYNIIIQTPSKKDKDEIEQWLKHNRVRFELWALEKQKVISYRKSNNGHNDYSWRNDVVQIANINLPLQMIDSRSEYCPLIATSLARSSESYPAVFEELKAVNKLIHELLKASIDCTLSEQHEANAILAKTNAGLSRFSSQTFSGTSPITGTECHYWTHSLLGTGMANMSLYILYSFIRDNLGLYNLPSRFENINNCKILPIPFSIAGLSHSDEFWYKDYLINTPLLPGQEHQNVFPLITYYSGRDGFKCSKTTLSAPLSAIGACNSRYWDLITLTHELTHLVIQGFLSSICPNRESDVDINHAITLLASQNKPGTWTDAIKLYFLQSVLLIHKKDTNESLKEVSTGTLKKILNRWYREIEELLTHVFDFLYFYRQDIQHYVGSIWSSWSVIPNISNRIEEYSIRTLCAILSKNLRKGAEAENITYEQTLSALTFISENDPKIPYVTEARQFIQINWKNDLKTRLSARKSMIALARAFFYSEHIAARLFKESQLSGSRTETDGYDKKMCVFDGVKMDNPLRFIKNYTRDQDPSPFKSLWILGNIGFNSKWH